MDKVEIEDDDDDGKSERRTSPRSLRRSDYPRTLIEFYIKPTVWCFS
jgi:hypothetical protein